VTLGLTLPGDTVLYLLLPLHAAVFGVTLPEAGLLLAANRLVRIAGYGWVARGYHRFGPRAACVAATFGAAAATLGYALTTGLIPLLVARLLWGLSFAVLNIATQALVTADAAVAGRRSGRSRAIISTGPMLGLLGGAMLAEIIGLDGFSGARDHRCRSGAAGRGPAALRTDKVLRVPGRRLDIAVAA
jgi:MFS family permease